MIRIRPSTNLLSIADPISFRQECDWMNHPHVEPATLKTRVQLHLAAGASGRDDVSLGCGDIVHLSVQHLDRGLIVSNELTPRRPAAPVGFRKLHQIEAAD